MSWALRRLVPVPGVALRQGFCRRAFAFLWQSLCWGAAGVMLNRSLGAAGMCRLEGECQWQGINSGWGQLQDPSAPLVLQEVSTGLQGHVKRGPQGGVSVLQGECAILHRGRGQRAEQWVAVGACNCISYMFGLMLLSDSICSSLVLQVRYFFS